MALAGTLGSAVSDRTLADRWIYVFMATLLAAVAVVGFAPKSTAILAGELPNPPSVIHIHAGIMVAWLALLLTQTLLMASGHSSTHRRLGLLSLMMGPSVVIGMIAATLWGREEAIAHGMHGRAANLLLTQGRAILYFALFFVWAVVVRRKDPETHKRMMLLATLVVIPAAITRMTWLPTTFPQSFLAPHLYMLVLLMPALLYDIARWGRPHSAYLAGLAALAPYLIAVHLLWNSPWWVKVSSALMGMLT